VRKLLDRPELVGGAGDQQGAAADPCRALAGALSIHHDRRAGAGAPRSPWRISISATGAVVERPELWLADTSAQLGLKQILRA